MSNTTFTNLQWLPKAAADYASRCKAVLDARTGIGREIQSLATSALDQNQLARLANTIDKLRSNGAELKPLVPFRLGLLSNSTTDFIIPAPVSYTHLDVYKRQVSFCARQSLAVGAWGRARATLSMGTPHG